jgi:hypothetical protein
LKPFLTRDKDPGDKNPTLADHAKNTCCNCLLTGHKASTEQCQQFRICHQLWGLWREFQTARRLAGAGTRRQADAADGSLTAGPESVKVQAATVKGATSGFPAFNVFMASVEVSSSCLSSVALAVGGPTVFLLDLGCQVHLTCIRAMFTQFQTLAIPIPINRISGHSVLATRKGHVELPVSIGDEVAWLQLRNVLYAPELGQNLVSTSALLEASPQVLMTTEGATISLQATPSHPLVHARFVDRLWVLDVETSMMRTLSMPVANVATMGATWHKRLNHIGINVLRKLASKGVIPLLTKLDLQSIQSCGTCILGKGVWLPFLTLSMELAMRPLELIHPDLVCGLDTSIRGTQYTATFIDNCTHMAWVFLLKHKSNLAHMFIQLHAKLELQTGHRIKVFCTDGGGKYTSTYLISHLADAGIVHQTTCTNSLQSNRVAEQFQRTLFDCTRCMLEEAGMKSGWWAEAALTAMHVYNLTLNTMLPNHASPLSLWSNKNISIKHLRVFGTICYTIDTSKHCPKLRAQATECWLLRYNHNSKAYRLQVKGSTKVIKTRDVVFHEDKEVPASPSAILNVHGNSVGEASAPAEGHADLLGASETLHDPEPVNSVGASDPSGAPDPRCLECPRREVRKTWKLRESANTNNTAVLKSYRQAMQGPHTNEWQAVVDGEFQSWKDKDMYEVQRHNLAMEVLPSITILSEKTDKWGVPVHKKARCVVHRDMQSELPEDRPTHSLPVVRFSTFCIMAAKAAITGCKLQQMDICTAFLHALLEGPTLLAILAGFPVSELIPSVPRSEQVLHLKKAVYGLKDALHSWYTHCAGIFTANGFTRSDNDHCLFSTTVPDLGTTTYILVYVDDFTLLADSADAMAWLKAKLSSLFDLKDLGAALQVLGIEVICDRSGGTLKLTQRKFV